MGSKIEQAERFLKVIETYLSLQGEGAHAGLPCFFVRTAVCDLRCSWCDTPQSWTGGTWMTRDEALASVPDHVRLVQLTGGEPMLQAERVIDLSEEWHRRGKKILLETGGHRSLEGLPSHVHIVMDIKLPSSGEAHHSFADNLRYLKKSDEIKFVIADRQDFEAALVWIRDHKLESVCELLLSPVWGRQNLADLARWTLEEKIDARMQVQLHKIVWGESATGV